MGIKLRFSPLVLILLAVIAAGGLVSSVNAEDIGARIIEISPVGQGRALATAYSPDGRTLAVGSSLGIHFYNTSTLQSLRFMPTDTWVRALAFSPDGSLLASGSYDPIVRLWRSGDGSLFKELSGHSAWVRDLEFSPDGKLLATASDDNTVRLWGIPDGNTVLSLEKGVEGVRALAISSNGKMLATGGFDHTIRLWNLPDGTLLRELKGHQDWVRALAFSPDGRFLASGAFDATVRLWRVEDGELLVTREEHNSSVLGLSFSPDGELLASASVDTSVRLWKMPTIEPYDLLRGHTDFVFDVAFSPDGQSLVSGSVDNTVRIWDVPSEASPAAKEQVSTPSNCKACHHPHGVQGPPRVIETGCSVCHAEGARAVNWCTAFTRSPGSTTLAVQLQSSENSGLFHAVPSAAVIIHSPGNGEVIYGQSYISYPLKVMGQVYYQGDPSDIDLTLEILSDDGSVSTVKSTPLPNGSFSFLLEGNHGATEPISTLRNGISIAGEAPCLVCHKDQFQGYLPKNGIVHLKVIMSTPDGTQASDERVVFVDSGVTAEIPIQVLFDEGEPITGLPIRADTRLYEWRGRAFNGTSDADNGMSLQVEALTQNSTSYRISIPPTVIDGILYESRESGSITLPPGAINAPAITLHVQAARGEIHGQLQNLTDSVPVWAISLPDGSGSVTSTTPQGGFSFTNLKAGQYLLLADPQALAGQGLALDAKRIDLAQSPSAQVDLIPRSLEGVSLAGSIMDENGAFLPFGWVEIASSSGPTDPASGAYTLLELPAEKSTVIPSAPGYYSQAHALDLTAGSEHPMDFRLVRRPETQILPWGEGTIVIPPETDAGAEGLDIDFEQGWLWGQGGSEQPLVILWGDLQITVPGGRFALERLPDSPGWFYLFDGQATIHTGPDAGSITIEAGEMAYMSGEDVWVAPYGQVVVVELRRSTEAPIAATWQPTLNAQIRDRLARIGISTAQLITLLTYSLASIALLAIPFLIIGRSLKKKTDIR